MTPREPRMSEEREKEIREVLKLESLGTTTFFNPKTVRELLAEVDRLRAELDDSRQTRLAIKLTRTEEERDALQARCEQYEKEDEHESMDCYVRNEELDKLKRIAEAASKGLWRTVHIYNTVSSPEPKLALFLDDPDTFRKALAAWEERG